MDRRAGRACGQAPAAQAPAGDGSALRFEDVAFSYDGRPFMESLSLAVAAGKLTGIVGPNGCGKSTLMKLAIGIEKPQAGRVLVEGADIAGLSGRRRARDIALLAQSLPPAPMTVRELVECGRHAHRRPLAAPTGADRAAVAEAMAETGVAQVADRPVAELSGGWRQRAYLAMTIAQQPRVMLLDEPTSALDIRAAHDILALARQAAAKRGQTACLAIHDLDLALRYCDEVVVIERGAVVAQGAPDAVAESGILERVFDVEVRPQRFDEGRAWTFFPRR